MAVVSLIDPTGRVRSKIVTEVASTPDAMARGLGDRAQVRPGTGMLFLFRSDVRVPFTVVPMRVPIDLIWLDRRGYVVGVAPNLVPRDPRPVVAPMPFRGVLETSAGTARSLGIGPGWRVA